MFGVKPEKLPNYRKFVKEVHTELILKVYTKVFSLLYLKKNCFAVLTLIWLEFSSQFYDK